MDFSIVNTSVLHEPKLVMSADAEPQIWRNLGFRGQTDFDYMWILTLQKVAVPRPYVAQESAVV